jgi:DNA-binding NtrC family response regulator
MELSVVGKAKVAVSKRILLVDDEHNALVALEKILSEDGYKVVIAGTEEHAISQLSQWNFDLIITDLFLLHKSCKNLLNKIRGLKARIPVILTSGHGDLERYIEDPQTLDMTPLTKPIEYAKLKRLIGKIEARNESEAGEGSDVNIDGNNSERMMPSKL